MNDRLDDSLLDRAKRLFGMREGPDEGAHGGVATERRPRGDENGELVGAPHGPDEGHFVNDPPLEERPSLHPTAADAGISDAARARGAGATDANERAGLRRDEYAATGAASGQVAMPGGEEPVVGDEDRDDRGRGIG
jgi:hypothetical protein